MTLTHILIFLAAAIPYSVLLPGRWHKWALFVGSVAAIYWLQPALRICTLDFVFPTATLAVVVLAWLAARAPEQKWTREDSVSAAIMAGGVLVLSFGRYLVPEYRLTPSNPPDPFTVALWLLGISVALSLINRLAVNRKRLIMPVIMLILALFVILKTEALAEAASGWLRDWQGQPNSLSTRSRIAMAGVSPMWRSG